MFINIPNNVKFIIDIFYKNNYEAFMVGGCVRDSLLGLVPKDYDIATSALPNVTQSLFKKTIPTGIQHGTITVVLDNESLEVTTYRTEGKYINNRCPESVEFISNIKDDLSRRDFTVNAIAYNNKDGLIDYFNGIEDIKNKIIRTVGNPNKRFQEDALRMLRAIRFSCQLGFKIEENTYLAIKANYKLIKKISIERVRDELCKILITDNPCEGLNLLKDTGILKIIIPEVYNLIEYTPFCNNHNRDVFNHTLNVIKNTSSNNLILRLSALFHDIGKLNTLKQLPNGYCYFPGHAEEGAIMSKSILSRLKFDNYTIDRISRIIYDHLVLDVNYMPTDGEIKRLLKRVGEENIFILFELQRADINSLWNPVPFLKKVDYISNKAKVIIQNKEPLYIKDLAVTGSDIINHLNIKQGKIIGEILKKLLENVIDDKNLNNKESLLKISESFI